MALPSCIHRFRRPPRGQLQRQVMITIRVVAWRERAYFSAHAIRATPEKGLAVSSIEPMDTSATRNHLDLRASNSGGPHPRHHIRSQIKHLLRTIRVMAWSERAYHPHMRQERLPRGGVQSRAASQQILQQLETIPTCEHPIPANFPHATT